MEEKQKHYGQRIQDDAVVEEFKKLHTELVNKVIAFCQKHEIEADKFSLSADGLETSIEYGEWTPATDSAFTIDDEFKATKNCKTKAEYIAERAKHQPLLFSI